MDVVTTPNINKGGRSHLAIFLVLLIRVLHVYLLILVVRVFHHFHHQVGG